MSGTTACGLLENGAYDLPLPGGADVGDDPTSVTIHFESVEGLVPKSTVKLNNVAVGRVEKIDVDQDTWTAVVTCTVRSDLDLPADVEARVRRSSLLGEWYVELVRPEGSVTDGADIPATIPISKTGGSARVEEVLGALSLLLNNGGLPQLNSIMGELNAAMDGNEPELRALLDDLTELTGHLDAHRDDIVDALDGLGELSHTLRGNNRQIERALERIPEGLKVLADQRPQLVRMLRSLDRLSQVTVRVVNSSKEDMVADLQLLRPILTSLARAGRDLPQALQILATFPFTPAAADAVRGDYVNLDAKVDLDLGSVLSALLASEQPLELGGQVLPNPLSVLGDTPAGDTTPQGSGYQGAGGSGGGSGQQGDNPLADLLAGLLGGRS
ncbi:MCE family protein [Nocardioides humilatus]|uniref:MCE family protein n=2 Tax=Nocardioides humilatus TaxID=2607660 RepID=A0A5B1LN81_9ACTN|nr:MCE family protein [Nocardioides humilatus]